MTKSIKIAENNSIAQLAAQKKVERNQDSADDSDNSMEGNEMEILSSDRRKEKLSFDVSDPKYQHQNVETSSINNTSVQDSASGRLGNSNDKSDNLDKVEEQSHLVVNLQATPSDAELVADDQQTAQEQIFEFDYKKIDELQA